MSLSSFCVVSNALRLNLFKMHDASKDRRRKGIRFQHLPESEVSKAETNNEIIKKEKIEEERKDDKNHEGRGNDVRTL